MIRTSMLTSAAAGCILLLHTTASFAQYCVPAYSACNTLSNNINTFFVTGENSTGLEVISSGNAANCYEYNTINTVIMQQGMSYQADMNSEDAGNNYVQIFVDFNDNFAFDPNTETVGGSNSVPGQPGTASFPITIPPGAQVGIHRMRVVLNMVDQMPNINPCPGANYAAGETNDFLVDVVAAGTICAPITNLTPSGITQTTATLTWTGATGIGYEYVLNQLASNPSGSGTPIAATTYNASSLMPGTAYYMHVRNNCGGGDYSNWVTTSFMTIGTPPSCLAITNLTASSVTSTTATLNWTGVTGSIGYEYVLDQVASNPSGAGTPIVGTTYNAASLTPSTTYYMHVRNNCGGGDFSTWTTINFQTQGTVFCAPVTNLIATNVFATTATIQWTAVVGSAGYQYMINQVATPPAVPGTAVLTPTYNATALTPNTTYYAHVRNNCGSGNFSTWVTHTFTTLPVGIDDVKSGASAVHVFPNPATDMITVEAAKAPSGKAEIQVTDIAGKIVKQISVSAERTTISLRELSNGIYLLRYTDAGNTQIIKISKQ